MKTRPASGMKLQQTRREMEHMLHIQQRSSVCFAVMTQLNKSQALRYFPDLFIQQSRMESNTSTRK
jgi:hypothetical protein